MRYFLESVIFTYGYNNDVQVVNTSIIWLAYWNKVKRNLLSAGNVA